VAKSYSKLPINEAVLLDIGAPWQQTSLGRTMIGMLVSQEGIKNQCRGFLAGDILKIGVSGQRAPKV